MQHHTPPVSESRKWLITFVLGMLRKSYVDTESSLDSLCSDFDNKTKTIENFNLESFREACDEASEEKINGWDNAFSISIIAGALVLTGAKLVINHSMSIDDFRKVNKETVKLAEEMLRKSNFFDQMLFDKTPPIYAEYVVNPLVTRGANLQQDLETQYTHALHYVDEEWRLYHFENNKPILLDIDKVNHLSKFLEGETIDEHNKFSNSMETLCGILKSHKKAINDVQYSEKQEYVHQCFKLLKLIVDKEQLFVIDAEKTIFKIQRELNFSIKKMEEKLICSNSKMQLIKLFLNDTNQQLQEDTLVYFAQEGIQKTFLEAGIKYEDNNHLRIENFNETNNQINQIMQEINENNVELTEENKAHIVSIENWKTDYKEIYTYADQLRTEHALNPILSGIKTIKNQQEQNNQILHRGKHLIDINTA